MIQLPFATLPASAYMAIVANDAFVHGWDLAQSTGQPTDIEPELAAQLLETAKALFQPGLRGPDKEAPFGPEVPAPAGASNADKLAAFLGRSC